MSGTRTVLFLLGALILTAFAAGYFALAHRTWQPGSRDYSALLKRGQQALDSAPVVHTLSDLRLDLSPELQDPATIYPSTSYNFDEMDSLIRYAESCAGLAGNSSKRLGKAWQWHWYLCEGKGPVVSNPRFFSEPPYLHPSGASYVLLAHLTGRKSFGNAWLKQNLHAAHLFEWKRLPQEITGLKGSLLSQLDEAGLRAWQSGALKLITAKHLLLQEDFSQGERWVVKDRAEIQKTLEGSGLSMGEVQPDRSCFHQEGNLCWQVDLQAISRQAQIPGNLLTLLALLISGGIAVQLVRVLRREKAEQERKRFALQTLTHELRTPITNLLLYTEQLKARFDELSPAAQSAALALSEESQRLLRLAETSRSYLKNDSGALVVLNLQPIVPLKEFLEAVAESAGVSANVECPEDLELVQDPFWLGMVLKNLLVNAAVHGKSPIVLRAKNEGDRMSIGIQDAGDLASTRLEDLQKQETVSRQLGLGLSLVSRIVREMGGALRIQKEPTLFTVQLPGDVALPRERKKP